MTAHIPGQQPTVGVVGLGNMGAAIAQAVIAGGLPTLVHDIRPEAVADLVAAGALAAGSADAVCRDADIICVVVLNEAQVSEVADHLTGLDADGKTFVVHSTVTPLFMRQLADRLAGHHVEVVDATVAGGVAKARTGELTVMVGGSDSAVSTIRPVLDSIGKEIFHVGAVGAGSAMKLIVNFTTMSTYALHLEAMELAQAYGLEEDAVTSVLVKSSADSKAIRTWGFHDRIRRNQPPGTAPVGTVMLKDLSAAATAAGQRGLVLPLASVAASTIVAKLAARDEWLDSLGEPVPIPRCDVCGLELAAPYRGLGRHGDCG
ncbi:NAD(P)-dependent oxidoreductase [Streptomyces sp. NPDC057137]|uniref:NAD(P)-dependent oxidoreductase n=1 Tax=Streptomyces sp. NPDC057137 TaxID=3346030 RepID=UPI0036331365